MEELPFILLLLWIFEDVMQTDVIASPLIQCIAAQPLP
jgi:hypothetical protein